MKSKLTPNTCEPLILKYFHKFISSDCKKSFPEQSVWGFQLTVVLQKGVKRNEHLKEFVFMLFIILSDCLAEIIAEMLLPPNYWVTFCFYHFQNVDRKSTWLPPDNKHTAIFGRPIRKSLVQL